MKSETTFDDIKREIKKLQSKSSSKTILFIILGIVAVGLATVLIIMKFKDKVKDDFSEYDDDEYVYYDDEDDDDFYEDYRALDYEDEQE